MKIVWVAIACAVALALPNAAAAEPVTAFVLAFTGATTTTAAVAAALYPTITAIGAFLGTNILGRLLVSVGLSYLTASRPKGADFEALRVNSRTEQPERYQLAGTVAAGGAAGIFGEYDADGNFWYIVAHGDAEITDTPTYLLDGIEATVAAHTVIFKGAEVLVATTGPITLSGHQTVDGVWVSTGNRVLVKDQADPSENGVYSCQYGAWVRAYDFTASAEFTGAGVKILWGTDHGGTFWRCETVDPVIGTDAISFVPTTDGDRVAGDVLTEVFCYTSGYAVYEGSGARTSLVRLYTVSPDANNVYGALPAAFTDAFPELPEDFRLAGVCFTIARMAPVPLEHRHKFYRWSGPMGLGEPTITCVANFNRMFDPRNPAHDVNDSATWTASDGNPAIIWAWWRTHRFGRGRPMSEVNWDKVAEQADICDLSVLDRTGSPIPLYRCGVAAKDTTYRHEVEQEILSTCDGFVAYDDAGLAYPVVGFYEEPTLHFDAVRDIYTARTETIDDGEAPVDGVVVRYTSPDHGWTKQSAAAWRNPNYAEDGVEPNYSFVDILGCQNHNQAVRLAKGIGLRIAPARKAAIGTTPKGILAKSERGISLAYDDDFTGFFEVATPVQEDGDGRACAFAVVPLQADRWDLNEGEEGKPPAPTPVLNIDDSLEVAANVVIISETIATDGGSAVRFLATFDLPERADRDYQFRYETDPNVYEYFTVDMEAGRAWSPLVADGDPYEIQWKTVTAGGRSSEWAADIGGGETVYSIVAVANQTPPAALVAADAADGTGELTASWTAANDPNQFAVEVRVGATSDQAAATLVETSITPANASNAHTEAGLTAGTYYVWLTPINGSGVPGPVSGPLVATVS